ncbi:Spore coat protein CotH [Thalassoporum mexicanum PCC 7367]|uniref:CotH kinase family protein n=1 Tax=Thalassoporum mexicanum TaxID=3457544 RepID=UPI00029FA29F|nr:CotH kinase family protein [Pseudanabaena sp. PCC 7367]AFY71571.1 Spore coat protein CotH [Pseudanabaena sp. PCC 7367]
MLIHKGDRDLEPSSGLQGSQAEQNAGLTKNANPGESANPVINGSSLTSSGSPRSKRGRFRSRLTTLGLTTLIIAGSFGAGYMFHKHEAHKFLLANLGNFNPSSIGRYLEALLRAPDLPTVQVDMKFKHYKDLARTRETALQRGRILAEDKYFVSAKLRYDGQVIPVKMRFKGNGIDHLDSEKWSFRVHVKDDKHFLGMRRFSLHSPKTRNYLYEWVWLENLRREGVLAPRYQFIDLNFNGSPKGVYAIEEHFSVELYESQQRREGIVITGNDAFEVSRAKRVDRDPELSQQRDQAIAMLKAFQEGQLAASEVFDVELMAKFLAIVELWRAYHTLTDWNTHFYYNPITAKLEPIGRDGYHYDNVYNWGMQGMDIFSDDIRGSGSRWRNQNWTSQVLQDPIISEAYVRELERISQPEYLEQVRSPLQKQFKELQLVLYKDPDIDPQKNTLLEQVWQTAIDRQEAIRQSLSETNALSAFVKVVKLGEANQDRRSYLQIEVNNRLVQPVEVLGFKLNEDQNFYPAIETWQDTAAGYTYYRPGDATVVLRPAEHSQVGRSPLNADLQEKTVFLIPLPPGFQQNQLGELPEIRIAYRFLGLERAIETTVYEYPQTAMPSLTAALAQHPFLEQGDRPDTLIVKPGQWDVVGDLVMPRGMNLQINPGTTLRFEPEAVLLADAGMQLLGTEQAPIRLMAQAEQWAGVATIALGSNASSNDKRNSQEASQSNWQHVIVEQTNGISRAGGLLESSITFHNSVVKIQNLQLVDSSADNALRFSNSEFEVSASQFINLAGDGIDAEFSSGAVSNSEFTNIQADAIDAEGTDLAVINSQFSQIEDKAISAGQGSKVSLQDLEIKDVGIGIASLDRAAVQIVNVAIENAKQAGLIAYQARSEWGSANMTARQVRFADTRTKTLIEAGSWIELDGDRLDGIGSEEFWAQIDQAELEVD